MQKHKTEFIININFVSIVATPTPGLSVRKVMTHNASPKEFGFYFCFVATAVELKQGALF